MALFSITRYGDDLQAADENYEQENLSKLQDKIEQRRRAKIQFNKTVESIKEEQECSDITQPDLDGTECTKASDDDEVANEQIPIQTKIDTSQFKILGVREFEKKVKVKRVLPYWLRNAVTISPNLKERSCKINDLTNLNDSLKKRLSSENIEYLFPVQAKVIPWMLEEHKMANYYWPRDLCVSAPTGSGKTLAYVLPIIQLLSNKMDRKIRALVVLPVKELASQVAQVFKDYCRGTNLKVALITGSLPYQQEVAQLLRYTVTAGLCSEVDIMVCTAGRLVEHLQSTEGFSLKNLEFLVIDEADRIMDHIQNDWLHHLNRCTNFGDGLSSGRAPPLNVKTTNGTDRPPQKLLFSATLSQDPEKLEEWGLFQPKLFSVSSDKTGVLGDSASNVGRYTTPLELTEKYSVCDTENKHAVLFALLEGHYERTLVFLNSAKSAHRLAVLLRLMMKDKKIAEMSSALGQKARDSILKKFQTGAVNVLVSTDALARGIDVVDCDCVVSFDPPKNAKTYVHRIGRTGRAGRSGTAVALLGRDQVARFEAMLKAAGKSDIEKAVVDEEALQGALQIGRSAVAEAGRLVGGEAEERTRRLRNVKRGRIVKKRPNKPK